MISVTPIAMDENESAAAPRHPLKQLGGLVHDDVGPLKQPLGSGVKSKTRRALGDLSSSQVNSRQVDKLKPSTSKQGALFKIGGHSSKEPFQVFDSTAKAVSARPSQAFEYYDEADFICSRGVSKPKDPADIVQDMSKNITKRMGKPKPNSPSPPPVDELPLFRDNSSDDIFDVFDSPTMPVPEVNIDLDAFDEHW